MNANLQKILTKLSNLSFLTLNKTSFSYGPPGRLFFRNLENFWFQHCITKPSYNVFLTTTDKIGQTIKDLKSDKVDSLPFGLAMIEQSKTRINQGLFNDFYDGSSLLGHKIAKVLVFNDANSIRDTFRVKQRERKIWWRKLACEPSRFVMTEDKRSKNVETVFIQAQFPFGNIDVEAIKCHHDVQKFIAQDLINEIDTTEIKAVEHVAYLDWACLALLCDGYQENPQNVGLRLHPKISPYKASFSAVTVEDDSESIKEDMKGLILYLNNLLRISGINTILTNDQQNSHRFQVPFVVNVDRMTLKNGIIRVSNQFTTLNESVHISKLIEHISSRCS